ncbi:ribonuclease H-like domain-containing protein [Tanacetum coccineum]
MTISELKECLRKKDYENEHLKSKVVDFTTVQNLQVQVKELQSKNEHLNSKVVDCTMCQNLQVQVEELKSVNESLNSSVKELYKARELAKATLRERDEMISAIGITIHQSIPSNLRKLGLGDCWELKASEVTTVSFGRSSSTSQNSQNVAFVSTNNTNSNCNSSTNEVDNTAHGVNTAHTKCNSTSGDNLSDAMICAFLASQPNSPQLAREDLEQIDPDDLEEIDLQREMAMLTIRARRFIQRTGRKLDLNCQSVGFDRTKVECYNCHKYAEEEHPTNFALMAFASSGSSSSSDSKVDSCSKSYVKAYATLKEQYDSLSSDYKKSQFNLVSYKAAEKERDELKPTLEKFKNSSKSLNNLLESQVSVKFKTGLGYNAASSTAASPAVESFGNSFEIENMDVTTIVTPSNVKIVESNHESTDVKSNGDAVEPKTVRKNSFRPPAIEDWNSDDDSEVEFIPNVEDKTIRPSTEKIKLVKVKDTTDRDRAVVSENKGKGVNDVKASACWGNPQQKEYKEKGVIDNGKGRISRKGKIKTGTLDFDNVYFCKELKYNLFSVSQICDKKNNVLFTDTECLVLSSDFKLLDESQVLLSALRKDNILLVDLKSVGIKREFSVARTPQQNSVAKRRNRTLIEATRTMLVDSKLPTTFWAEAVNTACYVLNRVLVIKPHNMTPYELILGRTPLIDFMKPFGCHVTILNTMDHLGKFDGKTDEEFFVGYFVVSKAMRVFNKRTRIVEETLNIKLLENTSNVTRNGPDWLFDVDSLTVSMNYVPVVAGKQTNGIAGTRDCIFTGQAKKKTEPKQEYILIPFCTTDSLISQCPKDSKEDSGMKPTEEDVSGALDKDGKDDQATRSEFERILQQEKQTVHPNSTNSINTVSTPVSATGPSFTNDDLSSPVNTAEASNAFEEHLLEIFSPFKNAFTLPPISNVTPIDDTGIFGNAYDDEYVGADVDLNNLETTMNVSLIPTTKIDKDHPKD